MDRGSQIGLVAVSSLALLLGACNGPSSSSVKPTELPVIALTEGPAFPLEAHLESADITAGEYDFAAVFDAGSKLFHTPFNGLDGVGFAISRSGETIHRFGVPGPGGPGSQTCGECHNFPFPSAAGLAHNNIAQDPDDDGDPPFNVRQTPSVLGNGLLQLLAQEMTEDLQAIRSEAETQARAAGPNGDPIRLELSSKGIDFGWIVATVNETGEARFDTTSILGVDADLVVKPLAWKGDVSTVRSITAGAAFGALGMQSEEILWRNEPDGDNDDGDTDGAEGDNAGVSDDPDGDGVIRELSVGDVTAMTVYTASQETPQDVSRLAELGLVAAPSAEDLALLATGRTKFEAIGCAGCHRPSLHLQNTVFEEPTRRGNGHYFSEELAERDPGYDPDRPFTFDLLADAQMPRVEAHPDGGAIVRLYGDLKRHRMGRHLADVAPEADDPDDEAKPIPVDQFLTAELWGVGNTGPWLHDGRAGTLSEAIVLHGEDAPPATLEEGRSEAQEARDAFLMLGDGDRRSVIAFLLNLVLFSPEDQD